MVSTGASVVGAGVGRGGAGFVVGATGAFGATGLEVVAALDGVAFGGVAFGLGFAEVEGAAEGEADLLALALGRALGLLPEPEPAVVAAPLPVPADPPPAGVWVAPPCVVSSGACLDWT
ncbi:hypothetical protein GCM10010230_52330 [Streptomyces narbonensis]|nr:hypothetical protein GCM10010230_52330 [Streptomyces narbonensis]